MVFPVQILWLFLVAMLISSIGFKHYIWFFSIGYGFAIAGEGLLLLLCGKEISLGALLCCLLLRRLLFMRMLLGQMMVHIIP